tara:strand:+ start:290 stop:400 length:111 start_codon:yes stop_codon:yes gene_type:complete
LFPQACFVKTGAAAEEEEIKEEMDAKEEVMVRSKCF